MVYYLKQVKPIDEQGSPYQGEIRLVVPVMEGYIPTEYEVQQFAPGDCETAVQVLFSLN